MWRIQHQSSMCETDWKEQGCWLCAQLVHHFKPCHVEIHITTGSVHRPPAPPDVRCEAAGLLGACRKSQSKWRWHPNRPRSKEAKPATLWELKNPNQFVEFWWFLLAHQTGSNRDKQGIKSYHDGSCWVAGIMKVAIFVFTSAVVDRMIWTKLKFPAVVSPVLGDQKMADFQLQLQLRGGFCCCPKLTFAGNFCWFEFLFTVPGNGCNGMPSSHLNQL